MDNWLNVLKRKYSNVKFRYHLAYLLITLAYWNFVIRIAIFLRLLGSKTDNIRQVTSKGMEFVADEIWFSSIIVSLFAILSWSVRRFVYPRLIQKYRIRRLALMVVFSDAIVFVFFGVLLGLAHYMVDKQLSLDETFNALGRFLFNSTILFFFIVLVIGSYFNQLLHTMFHQIGVAKLGRIMIGYYQKPREENLIFMFLDLRSSTVFAEKLGHERYSDFIQDCFRSITDPLLMTYGRVYQYVGDEVVVTWSASREKNFKKAIDFFYLFKQELARRKSYFESKYGIMPVFTASVNSGKVMAAEVGEIKTELAFHGDVLNTAARIQKQCKKYDKELLITHNFANHLGGQNNGYHVEFLDKIILSGKEQKVELYDIVSRN